MINDYIDIEADRINKPKRPMPSGKIKPRSALLYSIALFIIGLYFAYMTTMPAFILSIVNSAFLIIYATKLKSKMFVGNAVVSYLVGSTIVFGSLSVMAPFSLSLLILPLLLMLLSSLSNFSREVVKTLEDIEGDKLDFIKRAIYRTKKKILEKFNIENGDAKFRYRKRTLEKAAAGVLFLALAISPLPYVLGILGLPYLIFLAPADMVFLLSVHILLHSKGKRKYSKTSKLIKLGMFLGLLAYAGGIVF